MKRKLPKGLRKLKLQRRKFRRSRMQISSRRKFLAGWRSNGGGGWSWFSNTSANEPRRTRVRRSTHSPSHRRRTDDEAFQSRCIRCGLCGTVCENGCIRFFGLDEPQHGAMTPYLDLRRRSCTLCMRCTAICPTEALREVEDNLAAIAAEVNMGTAVVERDLCLSYLGRVCGYCNDACPLPGTAIRLTPPALPVVLDGCVGCGRCVELCPQTPTAISVVNRAVSLRTT